MIQPDLTYRTLQGAEIAQEFEQLGTLRISVFHDYPYLYEGTIAHEKEYLKIYSSSPRALLFAAFDDQKMVGATTCIPLCDETEEVQIPFQKAGYDITKIFYWGESILLSPYRGLGIGHRFFDEREAHARSFGDYDMTCFCAVDRGDSHPAKPSDYRPNDLFWEKRGYVRDTSLQTSMTWQDIGENAETSKPMIFWTRSLHA
jgi:GNAT superfamily N-acetyltransferase